MSNVLRLDDYREKIAQEKPVKEVKKVSVDDGYTSIPNALIDAILDGNFTKNQIKLILGVIRKTTSWRKEMDWICNEQLAELCHLCDKFEASRVKKQLIKMNVLIQEGRKIGVNLFISDWLKKDCANSQYCKKHTQKNVKTYNQDCRNSQPQKETITKEKINIPPLPPKSELACSENKNFSQAQELLAYYNEIAKSHCKDSSPFLPLLEKNRYTVDEIKLVINWVLTCWNRRNGKPAKPKNICVKSRFDGYLSDAITWNERRTLCKEVIEAYNEILGERLIPMDEVDQLAETQINALLPLLARQDIYGFRSYFQAFADNAREYYFRPENKYGFSYLMKPETLFKTRRGEL
ncbi:replication protein [Pasteurella multocida]